jgi:hypothetical protein
VTKHVLSVADIVSMIEATELAPAKRGPCKKEGQNLMRGALVGLIAILAAIPVFWILRLLRVNHDYDFMDLAGLMVGAIPLAAIALLLVCRFFGLWPFSN